MTLWQNFAGACTSLALVGGTALGAIAPALAQTAQAPVAVVEEVNGKVVGVEFMDYVRPGKVIKLGPNGSIVLGYMKSCWRETVTGGTVVIGAEESLVHLGEVQRVKFDCDRHGRPLSDRPREVAGAVFRALSRASR